MTVENRMCPADVDPRFIKIPAPDYRQYYGQFPSECRVFSVRFKKLNPNAVSPTRNHIDDAGLDLYALEDIIVPSLSKLSKINDFEDWNNQPFSDTATKVKTGIALEIPKGMYGLILDRSSMGSKLLKGLAGVIDSGYRGDVTVCLANLSFHDYHIKAGDKIAQIVFHKYEALQPIEAYELDDADRGDKGFGSSGK